MADARVLSVRLRAEVGQYNAALMSAGRATQALGSEVTKTAATHKKAMSEVGRASLIGGAALLGIAAAAVKVSADFEKSMSGVRAATRETASNMGLLRAAALKAGADTAFSATQAADGITELAKAGISTQAILSGGLAGALNLAAAGQIDVGEAAETAASAMTQFGLAGNQVPHIADLLSAGSSKAQGSVHDLGEALGQSGQVASQMGLSIEDTVGALTEFASAGLTGSDAGTSFKQMLLSLTPSSTQAAAAMKKYGLSFFDANGNLKSFQQIAGTLQSGLGDLTKEQQASALKTIFGADAYRTAAIAMDGGAAAADKWRQAVADQGFAAKAAAILTDNLRGDIERLGGSVQSAMIDSGSGAGGLARGAVQQVTGMVNAYSALPGPAKTAATATAAVGGAAAVASGAFLLAAPRIVETKAALSTLSASAPRTVGAMTAIGKGVGIMSAAFIAWQAVEAKFGTSATEMQFLGDRITAMAGPDKTAQVAALTAQMEKLRVAQHKGLDTDLGFTDIHWTEWSGGAGKAGDEADALQARIKALKHEIELEGIQSKVGAGEAQDLGDGLGAVTPPAREAAEALKGYTDALGNTAAIDAYTATAQLAKSFHDLSRSLKDGGRVTNDEKIKLGGYASQVKETAQRVLDHTKATKGEAAAVAASQGVLERGRDHLAKLAEKAGLGARQANRLSRELVDIPSVSPTIHLNTGPAIGDLHALIRNIQSSGATLPVALGTARKVAAGGAGHAVGGFIRGPGSSTSDSIPAWLSDGEFVVNAKAVGHYGVGFLKQLNAMRLHAGGLASEYALASACSPDARAPGLAPIAATFAA